MVTQSFTLSTTPPKSALRPGDVTDPQEHKAKPSDRLCSSPGLIPFINVLGSVCFGSKTVMKNKMTKLTVGIK